MLAPVPWGGYSSQAKALHCACSALPVPIPDTELDQSDAAVGPTQYTIDGGRTGTNTRCLVTASSTGNVVQLLSQRLGATVGGEQEKGGRSRDVRVL